MASVDPTSDAFRWHLDAVVPADCRNSGDLLYDIWFDYQLWRRRDRFAGGLCDFHGAWPDKSVGLAGQYAGTRRLPSLDRLTAIPQAYAVMVDLRLQGAFLREFLIPFMHHYRNAGSAPAVLVFGKYSADVASSRDGVLEVRPDPSLPGRLRVGVSPGLAGLVTIGSPRLSSPASVLSPTAPYVMVSAELAVRSLVD